MKFHGISMKFHSREISSLRRHNIPYVYNVLYTYTTECSASRPPTTRPAPQLGSCLALTAFKLFTYCSLFPKSTQEPMYRTAAVTLSHVCVRARRCASARVCGCGCGCHMSETRTTLYVTLCPEPDDAGKSASRRLADAHNTS